MGRRLLAVRLFAVVCSLLVPAALPSLAPAAQQPKPSSNQPSANPASPPRPVPPPDPRRFVESVLPSLDYGNTCWSSITLQNLSDRAVTALVEAHRASGALVPLVNLAQSPVTVEPGGRATYRLDITGDNGNAWVKIRERIPSPDLSAAIAVSGTSDCVVDNHLLSTGREVAFPTRNPWFSSDVDEMHGNLVSLVNVSERPALASLCYSSGNLYSLPGRTPAASELKPICTNAFDVQIPPFGARQFPVEYENSVHFSMKTQGEAIVLQMLRPLHSGVKVYSVDSTIKFEGPTR